MALLSRADRSAVRDAGSPEDPVAAAESSQAAMSKQIAAMQRDLQVLQKSADVQRELKMPKNSAGGYAAVTAINSPKPRGPAMTPKQGASFRA